MDCRICRRQLDNPDDPLSRDCGGDCLLCMAEAGDPECKDAVIAVARTMIRAGRLLRAAAEDAQMTLKAIAPNKMSFNQAMAMRQALTNLDHALAAAERAGVARARTLEGDG